MTTKSLRIGFLLAVFTAMAMDAPVVLADPQLQRPLLENYSDYNQFLIDMAAYKQHLKDQQQETQQAASPDGALPQSAQPATAVQISPLLDADDESAPPPLDIKGPEDLDNAIEAAKSFPHPSYHSTRRYNRSTAQSFRLPQLDQNDLEGSAVQGMWVGDTSLPDDVMGVDANALDRQATVDAGLKEIYRSIFAEKKADQDSQQEQLQEAVVKDMGETPRISFIPQAQIAYPMTSDGVGSVQGLYHNSGTMVVTRHGETN